MFEIQAKMTERPTISPFYSNTRLDIHIPFENDARLEIMRQLSELPFDENADYTVTIKKVKKKRTKDQNAYAWELIGKLARKLHVMPIEVYREIVRDMYTYMIVTVREQEVDAIIEYWSQKGTTGWVAEDMGECFNEQGAHDVKLYIGTSKYDKETMADFLDRIVEECRIQKISTLTPDQIKALGEHCDDGMDKSLQGIA